MNVKGANVSETEMGIGGTSQWKFCALGSNTTPAVFFEVNGQMRRAVFLLRTYYDTTADEASSGTTFFEFYRFSFSLSFPIKFVTRLALLPSLS